MKGVKFTWGYLWRPLKISYHTLTISVLLESGPSIMTSNKFISFITSCTTPFPFIVMILFFYPFSNDVINEWPLTNVAGENNPGFVEGITRGSSERRILKHQHQDHHKKGKTVILSITILFYHVLAKRWVAG